MSDVPPNLSDLGHGTPQTAEQLLPLVYDELRKLAARRLAQEKPGHTLQATALVHDAYLRIVGPTDAARWSSRGHFFAAAAEAMRRILVEAARRKQSLKHGGQQVRRNLDDASIAVPGDDIDILALDEALDRLAIRDAEAAKLVTLRFFAGMSMREAAAALELSDRSAERLWAYARSFLALEMNPPDP